MRTKARIRFRKMERIHRQSNVRIMMSLSADQRHILALSREGYSESEIARELALPLPYVARFRTGLVQRLTHEGVIAAPEWRNVIKWAEAEGIVETTQNSRRERSRPA